MADILDEALALAASQKCAICKAVKPMDAFSPSRRGAGAKHECRLCRGAYMLLYNGKHRDRRKKYATAYYEENRATEIIKKRQKYAVDKAAILFLAACKHAADPQKAVTRVKKWRQENPDKRAAQSRRRRAKHSGAQVEKFTPLEIFERDKFICYVCGEQTLPYAKETRQHPLAPSLDHIIPLSQDGDHTRQNTTCAHKRCNTLRGTRPWHEHCDFLRGVSTL